jgi:hypothetical protein
MRQSVNVLRFPMGSSGGMSLKAFAILFYISLAAVITNPLSLFPSAGSFSFVLRPVPLSGDSLGLLIVLGLLYGVIVKRWHENNPIVRRKSWVGVLFIVLLVLSVLRYLPFLLLLAVLYWALVARTKRTETPYFLRFHLLTGLIANGLALLGLLILQSLIGFVDVLSRAGGADWFFSVGYWYGIFWPYLTALLFWILACRLAFAALMGRTPYISLVTDNVRHWA